jgi:hypothetical protein
MGTRTTREGMMIRIIDTSVRPTTTLLRAGAIFGLAFRRVRVAPVPSSQG